MQTILSYIGSIIDAGVNSNVKFIAITCVVIAVTYGAVLYVLGYKSDDF